jgi:type IV pilus assembly protein PilX
MMRAWPVARGGELTINRKQRGLSLLIVLLALIAMSLAGLALVRSVDTTTLVAGNLAFRQSATISAETGVEAAIGYLRGTTTAALQSDGSGYYAKLPAAAIDFTGNATASAADDFDWSKATSVGTDAAGNSAAYVIHRLCDAANGGPIDPATCTTAPAQAAAVASEGGLVSGATYRDPTLTGPPATAGGLYRITVRVTGPKHTVSYVQVIVIV